jgi:integrase
VSGSIYQRTSDGRWCASVCAGGKRIVRYATSERDAKRILVELQRELILGRLAAPVAVTLAEWVEQWLSAASYRPSTLASYRQVLAPVLAEVGFQRLDKLTPALLHAVFVKLKSRMGARRRQQAYAALHRCLEQAVALGLLGTNPLARVEEPAWTPGERQYWSCEEAARFVTACLSEPRRWSSLFVVLAVTGIRIGEALGLQWQDVDLVTRTVRIERAYVCSNNQCHLVPPKTRAGRRTVHLPAQAVAALRLIPRTLDPSSFVFHDGTPPWRSTLRMALIRECKRAGVPVINIHGLRHVSAQLALAASGDIHAVKQRLGHSTVAVTLGLYGYALSSDAEVAGQLETLLEASL